MKIILSKKKLIEFGRKKKKLGFVPTMGAIHLGHISMIRKSLSQCDTTVVSIFVNKPQFNKKSDYKNYPRNIEKDISILKKLKIHCLYLPREKEIYPRGKNNKIKIHSFGNKLCGKSRPGHFKAVADVIDRFINIIKPSKIYFGEKDMQQLVLMQDFVKRNHNQTKVIPCKTIREKNGLALSSRNFLLSNSSKEIGSRIYKLIKNNKKYIIKNKLGLELMKKAIYNLGVDKLDYLKKLDINKIIKPFKKNKKIKIFISYYLEEVRLIDNI